MNNRLDPNNEADGGLAQAAQDQLAALSGQPGETLAQDPQAPSDIASGELARLREYVDIQLIRREARLIPTLLNLWTHFRIRGARTDQRFRAAVGAFLWRIFSPGVTAAAAGGVLLILGTFLQVFLIAQQNEKLDQQTHLMQAQSNVPLISQLGPLSEDLTKYARASCLSSRNRGATADMADCWIEVPPNQRARWVNCWEDDNCVDRDMYETYPEAMKRAALSLPLELQSRIVLLTLSARPYRFVDDRPIPAVVGRQGIISGILRRLQESTGGGLAPTRLIERPLSPERGALLRQLVTLGYEIDDDEMTAADFSSAYSRRFFVAELAPLHMRYVSMPYADFVHVPKTLHESDFECTRFMGADMFETTITGGKFTGALFKDVTLPQSDRFNPSDLTGAVFEAAYVKEPDFLARVARKHIKGFDPSVWEQVRRNADSYTIRHKTSVPSPPPFCDGLNP